MKRFIVIALIFVFILGCSVALYAEGATASRLAIGNKFARGSKNVLFGWTELPKRIVDITKESNNPIWGLLAGTWQGTLKAMARTASGVSDIVTAPIDPEAKPFIGTEINVK